MPAGKSLSHSPLSLISADFQMFCPLPSTDLLSWFTSVRARWKVSRCFGSLPLKPCLQTDQIMPPMRASVPADSLASSTSAVVATVSQRAFELFPCFYYLSLLPLQPLCSPDSPVFISHPHFFNADPVLLDYVQGLSPNEDEHGLFIDIHPVSTQKHPHTHTMRLQP